LNSEKAWAKLLRDRVVKNGRIIQYHIYSSLWSSIKDEYPVILENSIWLLGKGNNINFWNDCWCGESLASLYNIPDHITRLLTSSVSDYIHNGQWNIPFDLHLNFPNLNNLVQQVTLPLEEQEDSLQWKHSQGGDLQLKEAYSFKHHHFQELSWAKLIWNVDVPPSKSMFVWRMMHGKVPTDENLMIRGCNIPSMCSLCFKHVESSFHIFFTCSYAVKLWSWLASVLNISLNFSSLEEVWKVCDLPWSPQCKVVILSALINLFNIIWFARNQARFNNKHVNWKSAISMIIANTSIAGNATRKSSTNSVRDFTIIKTFNVSTHQPRAPIIKEVIWSPPLQSWIKCNIDGASIGNPGNSACGGIFRNHEADFVCCFAEPLGNSSSYLAELNGALRAIDLAFENSWNNIWLETDSSLVVLAFQNEGHIPWSLRNRWHNMKFKLRQINCIVTHIYREGNEVADTLANFGLSLQQLTVWQELPSFINSAYVKNKSGLPSYRFISF
jgi:ribonuclease HI